MNRTTVSLFFLGIMLLGRGSLALEKPEYEVLHADGKIEYRLYSGYVVAETAVKASDGYNGASNEGFRRLFKYITGANAVEADIAMTAPVQMSMPASGEKIDMTAPVQTSMKGEELNVAFMLPSQFSFENAPQPTDTRVVIKKMPARVMAVIRYSGRWTEANREKYAFRLQDYLNQNGVVAISGPESAAYNAPFTPPFMRRNEIMFEIEDYPGMEVDEEV